jgi:hypothetical protein
MLGPAGSRVNGPVTGKQTDLVVAILWQRTVCPRHGHISRLRPNWAQKNLSTGRRDAATPLCREQHGLILNTYQIIFG